MKRSELKRTTPLRRPDGKARATAPVQRSKKCRICKEPFIPRRPMAVACSFDCEHALALQLVTKAERRADQVKRAKLRTAKDWRPLAQAEFNRYIRLRDAGLPCICCGKPMEPDRPGGAVDAGHYLSVGSAPNLRFDERNVHAQRKSCNRPGGTTRAAFRAGMIERIGLAAVEAIEADQAPKHYSADDLKAIRDTYRARARELANQAKDSA